MNNMEDRIEEFISEVVGMDNIDYDLRIFDEGLVNSLFAIELMTFIEREFELKISVEDLDMENFQTINNIKGYILNKKDN